LLSQPSVSGVVVSLLVSGLMLENVEHILWCFYGQCVTSVLRIFEFGVLLFDCFVYHQNVTCLKRFTRYGHYAGDVEGIIIGRLAVVS